MKRIKLQVRFALLDESGVGGWNHCKLQIIRTTAYNNIVISRTDIAFSNQLRSQNWRCRRSCPLTGVSVFFKFEWAFYG